VERKTAPRDAILKTLSEAPGPLTPGEIHERAGQLHPTLGLATVYRNINRLEEKGDVVAVHLPEDPPRYEPAGRAHHHHFRCRECGHVFELEGECPVAILQGVTLPGGFRVEDHELTLYGICSDCQEA